jgi:hypothetical protein
LYCATLGNNPDYWCPILYSCTAHPVGAGWYELHISYACWNNEEEPCYYDVPLPDGC